MDMRLMLGSFVFGAPESPREEMIQSFLGHYRADIAEKHRTAGTE
jgi:hypothetical protein